MSRTKGIKMWKGVLGKNAATCYSCSAAEQAKADKRGVVVVSPRGKEVTVPSNKVRIVHRPDFTGTFSEVHERAGEGKYIASEAWDGKMVVGAQHVVPYLAHESCYASIVQAWLKDAGIANLKDLRAIPKRTKDDGEYLDWQGKRNADDCLVASPWRTRDEVWELTRALNTSLPSRLRNVKSQRKGVKEHMPPRKKFLDNINVMRRVRSCHNPATGETREVEGGLYPYGVPLEQAGFAIDYCFLTDGYVIETDAKGNKYVVETGDYYLRLVVGRSTPWVMLQKDWAGCDINDRFAFKSEKVRQSIIEARKRLDKTKSAA